MEAKIMTRPTSTDQPVKEEGTTDVYGSEPWGGDAPGTYDVLQLKQLLLDYLAQTSVASSRIRDILLPACLKNKVLTREQLKTAISGFGPNCSKGKIRSHVTLVSSQLGMLKNDFLRQVIQYGYPNHHWEKDHFFIKDQYRTLVAEVLEQLKTVSHASSPIGKRRLESTERACAL